MTLTLKRKPRALFGWTICETERCLFAPLAAESSLYQKLDMLSEAGNKTNIAGIPIFVSPKPMDGAGWYYSLDIAVALSS